MRCRPWHCKCIPLGAEASIAVLSHAGVVFGVPGRRQPEPEVGEIGPKLQAHAFNTAICHCTRYSGTCVCWCVCEGVYVGDGVLLVFQVWAAAFWKVSLSDSGINVMSVKCKLILFTSTVHSILSLTHYPPSLSLKPSHARTPLCRDLSDVNISTVAYACGCYVNSKEFVRPSPAEELDITTIPRGASCADALGWM